jgi:hypothetical protein
MTRRCLLVPAATGEAVVGVLVGLTLVSWAALRLLALAVTPRRRQRRVRVHEMARRVDTHMASHTTYRKG